MSQLLAPGDPAPDFSAIAVGGAYGDGQTIKLSDFKGKTVVLYFYPKHVRHSTRRSHQVDFSQRETRGTRRNGHPRSSSLNRESLLSLYDRLTKLVEKLGHPQARRKNDG
jgi:AhpC/TSA family protein